MTKTFKMTTISMKMSDFQACGGFKIEKNWLQEAFAGIASHM